MKIKQITEKKYKLLKLKLIKTKIYKLNKNNKKINNLTIEEIEHKLKKALNILYQFHLNNKKILFICNPLSLNKKIKSMLIKNNHSIINESIWKNGTLSDTSKSNILNLFLKIKKKKTI